MCTDVIYAMRLPIGLFDALWNAFDPLLRVLRPDVLNTGVAHMQVSWRGGRYLLFPDEGAAPGEGYPLLDDPTTSQQLTKDIGAYIAMHGQKDVSPCP